MTIYRINALDMATDERVCYKTVITNMNTRFNYTTNMADFHHHYMYQPLQFNSGNSKISTIVQQAYLPSTARSMSILQGGYALEPNKDLYLSNDFAGMLWKMI